MEERSPRREAAEAAGSRLTAHSYGDLPYRVTDTFGTRCNRSLTFIGEFSLEHLNKYFLFYHFIHFAMVDPLTFEGVSELASSVRRYSHRIT